MAINARVEVYVLVAATLNSRPAPSSSTCSAARASGELSSLVIAMAEGGLPVILISYGAAFRREMVELADIVRLQGARVITLADELPGMQPADSWIPLPPGEPEWLTPIAAILPGQLLAFHLTRARGMDPDRPRHIRKVTLTH